MDNVPENASKNMSFEVLMDELNKTANDADIRTGATVTFKLYKEFVHAGFSAQQALQIVIEMMKR